MVEACTAAADWTEVAKRYLHMHHAEIQDVRTEAHTHARKQARNHTQTRKHSLPQHIRTLTHVQRPYRYESI